MHSDEEIRDNIRKALRWDARIDEKDVDVEVRGRIVYLGGCVNSYSAKAAAEELASNSGDVAAVENDISVVPFTVETDATLIADVESSLLRDPRVDADDIVVGVRNGVVTLSGTATTLDEKASAEEDARNNFGVTDVKNRLEIVPPLDISDREVTAAVLLELGEDADLPDDLDVTVRTEAGKVYVSGRVDNERERTRIEDIIWNTPGVKGYVLDLETKAD